MTAKTLENIPLNRKSGSAFNQAVKNIQELIKAGDITINRTQAATSTKSKGNKKQPRDLKVHPDRGVVYLAHVPHGFYEEEMKKFFSQFGHVTRLRLVRSNKTGNSRGYAFIEFRFSEIAKVVAETMNNYLMRNRLLKATYIPPEKQNPKMFLHSINYGPETCVGLINRKQAVKNHNKPLSSEESQQRVNNHKLHLSKLQEKLRAQGIDFVFQVDNGTSEALIPAQNFSIKPKFDENPKPATASGSIDKKKSIKRINSKTSEANSPPKKQKRTKETKTVPLKKKANPIQLKEGRSQPKKIAEKSKKTSVSKSDKLKSVQKKNVKKNKVIVKPKVKASVKKVPSKKPIATKKK